MTKQELKVKLLDPIYFIKNILGVSYLTDEQTKIIISVFENKFTGVKACHSVGKTFLAACVLLAFIVPRRGSMVVSTAPTGRQVRDLLWSEVNSLFAKSKYPLGGQMNQMNYMIAPKWFATGVATEPGQEEQSAVKIQGYHAPQLLAIIDEAVGVHAKIWEGIDGITNSEGSHVLAIANPSIINCAYKSFLDNPKTNNFQISALSHPNVVEKKEVVSGAVSYEWVKDKVVKWCEKVTEKVDRTIFEFEGELYLPNSLFLWKVLGEFPNEDSDSLISYMDIQAAMERVNSIDIDVNHLSLDVARFGTDLSVFCHNKNNHFTFKSLYHFDVAKLSGEAIKMIKELKPSKFSIDCDGIGAGVYDNVNEWITENNIDIELVEIHGGAMPYDLQQTEEFLNLRAQMFWFLRNDIYLISLEENENLLEGLASIKYFFNSKGKIQIESKDDFKKRFGRSSDYEDALAYCNALKYSRVTEMKIAFD